MSRTKIASIVAGMAGVAIAALVGYLLLGEARKAYEGRSVVSIIGDATAQLKQGLKSPSHEALEKVEADLREIKGWKNQQLAEATEQYLVGTREILRRRIDASQVQQRAAQSRAALSAHMTRASMRDQSWIRTALDLKKQVERDHFDLDVQLTALYDLLRYFPEANKQMAPHVEASLLLDEPTRRNAQRAVQDEARRAKAELQETRAWVR